MMPGYIYMLGNTAMPTFYKIGRSHMEPSRRAMELSRSSGVPEPFQVVCFILVENVEVEEAHLHALLGDFRHSGRREFFRFAQCHLPWVLSVFRHHPSAMGFHLGNRMAMFPGFLAEDMASPWREWDDLELTQYSPDYAFFDMGPA